MDRFWFILPSFIEHDKPQGTTHKGAQGFLTILVQMIRSALWDLRRRKKQTFQKIAFLRDYKNFCPNVPRIIEDDKHQETIYKFSKLFWHLLWNLKEHFLGHKMLLKTQIFEKKATFPLKRFWIIFFLSIEPVKCQETK